MASWTDAFVSHRGKGYANSLRLKDLAEQSIDKVDYVVCNLYPFKARLSSSEGFF